MKILLTEDEILEAVEVVAVKDILQREELSEVSLTMDKAVAKAQLKKIADYLCDYGEDATLSACWQELKPLLKEEK